MEASVETGRQVGALVHRSGVVDYVIVGDSGKLMLPDIGRLRAAEGRFRGLRLVHTHVRGEPLTRDDLVDLVRLRLDLVCAIQINARGEAKSLHYAHNVPGKDGELPYVEYGPLPVGQAHVHVGELMSGLEAEFARQRRLRDVRRSDGRAIVVHVGEKSARDALSKAEESLRELRELARTAGVEVVDTILQLRERIDPRLVLGKGKLDDVILRSMQLDADVLIFDRELTPTQASSIAKESDLKVIDRTQLILDIFAQRAESKDGKIQVELAQLKYNMPRLVMKDDSLSRLTGGIGGRGPGETKLEIGRRRAKERVSHLESLLRKFGKQREQRRRRRTRAHVPTVAIVGYTNAGKSTLLNTLTGASVLAEDKLFATLDTRSRHIVVPWPRPEQAAPPEQAEDADENAELRTVVLTDTVGFIRNLPKDLFASFRATFEEAEDADLLLQVVDASDSGKEEHLDATEEVLRELELERIPRVVVFNKVDLLTETDRRILQRKYPDSVLLSAEHRDSTRPLLARLASDLHAIDLHAREEAAREEAERAAFEDEFGTGARMIPASASTFP